jgi:hypothetical protein
MNFRDANLPVSLTPYQGMTKTLGSLLISAALSMPVFAQPAPASPHNYLYDILFPQLKTDAQVAELVKKAGFNPSFNALVKLNRFEAALPTCTMEVWFTVGDDANNLAFVIKIRELTDAEAQHSDDLLNRLARATPAKKFDMFFRVMQVGNAKPALLLYAMLPNRGATPSEVKDVVAQLADVGLPAANGPR